MYYKYTAIAQHCQVFSTIRIGKNAMPFHLIKGTFHVTNYSPDGDTIRFQPDNEANIARLSGVSAKFNARRHVSLRLEGIDTLETHFSGLKQPPPLADDATDFLLDMVGITNVVWSHERRNIASADDGVRGHIMARSTDKFGRIIAFAFAGNVGEEDGAEVFLDQNRLSESVNSKLASEGFAYPTFYWGLFADLRDALTETVAAARDAGKGVYAVDQTISGVEIASLKTITDEAVILPKLFRRLSAYIKETGGVAGFKVAMEASEEPVLDLRENNFTHFDTFIVEEDSVIRLTRRPEEFVFDPMPERIGSDFPALLATAANVKEASSTKAMAVGPAESMGGDNAYKFHQRVEKLLS